MVIGLNDPQVLPSVGPNMSHWVHQQLTGCVSYSGISGLTTFDSVQTLHDSPVLTNHTLTPRLFTNNIANASSHSKSKAAVDARLVLLSARRSMEEAYCGWTLLVLNTSAARNGGDLFLRALSAHARTISHISDRWLQDGLRARFLSESE